MKALLSCLRGFVSNEGFEFVGSPDPDSLLGATVNTNEHASLCFSDPVAHRPYENRPPVRTSSDFVARLVPKVVALPSSFDNLRLGIRTSGRNSADWESAQCLLGIGGRLI
jgi:hypothetical protein